MRHPYWLAGFLLLTLTACSHKSNPQAADNSLPGHVGANADKTTPLTEPTPGNPTGITPHGGTGGPTRNDTGAGGENSATNAPGESAQGAQH